jgi:hypothetical protein
MSTPTWAGEQGRQAGACGSGWRCGALLCGRVKHGRIRCTECGKGPIPAASKPSLGSQQRLRTLTLSAYEAPHPPDATASQGPCCSRPAACATPSGAAAQSAPTPARRGSAPWGQARPWRRAFWRGGPCSHPPGGASQQTARRQSSRWSALRRWRLGRGVCARQRHAVVGGAGLSEGAVRLKACPLAWGRYPVKRVGRGVFSHGFRQHAGAHR